MPSAARFASFDGTKIAYLDIGEGPPVLLLHGFAAEAATNWVRPGVVDALTAAGHRVIALDARGHGSSDKPHDPGAYGDNAMVRDAAALLDHVGVDEVGVVGYSMGSFVAARLVAGDLRARSLVLGGVGNDLVRAEGHDDTIATALSADDPTTIDNPVGRAFRAFADSTGADRLALAAVARSGQFAEPAALGDIAVATLVLCGENDLLVGSPHDLAAAIPGARTRIIPGDHLGAVVDPQFAPAIVDFLADVERSFR